MQVREKILLFTLCLFGLTNAWTFVMVKDRDMVDTTEVILEGQVASYGPSMYSNLPATDYQVVIENLLKGNEEITKATTQITVTVLGGLDPNNQTMRLHVSGAPEFAPGDHVLLFLAKHKGVWTIHHFALGAFHKLADEEGTYFAARNLDERLEGKSRNFNLFKEWIGAALNKRGEAVEANYFATPSGTFKTASTRYNLDKYGNFYARWAEFDQGSSVDFLVNGETTAIANGGNDQIDEGMNGWNNEATTNIWYRRTGTTTVTKGLTGYDGVNSIVWNDPNDEIAGSFDCSTGGTLAIGGWWSTGQTVDVRGQTFNKIASGDVVVQTGIECWITGASDPDNSLNALFAHELGHTLGLYHSCGDSQTGTCVTGSDQDLAVMRSYIALNRGPVPGADDVAAIDILYLSSGDASSTTTTTTTTTADASTTSASTTSTPSSTSLPSTTTTTGSNGQVYFGNTLYYLIITIPQTSASSSELANTIANVLGIDSIRIFISGVTTPGKISGSTDVSFYIYEEKGQTSSYDLGNLMVNYVINGNPILAQNGLTVYYIYLWYIPNTPGNKPATPDGSATPALEGAGPTSPSSGKSSSNAAIIGGAVGGGVALIAIVGLTVVLIKRRQKNQQNGNFGY